MIDYAVTLRNPSGLVLRYSLPFSGLRWSIAEMRVGDLSLVIPGGVVPAEWFEPDSRLEIWRSVDGLPPGMVGGQWFVDKISVFGDAENIALRCVDMNGIIARRIVNYYASTDDSSYAYTDKNDQADDMIKAFVHENMGAGCLDTARIIPGLTVAANVAAAPTVRKRASRTNLLKTISDIAEDSYRAGTYLTWGWAWDDNNVLFQTFTGQLGVNHGELSGDAIVVSRATGNLLEAEAVDDYTDEVNWVDVGGAGTGSARAIGHAENSARLNVTPYSRREYFGQGQNTATVAILEAEARAKIGALRARRLITGRMVDTPGLRFGVNYGFGDVVSVSYAGRALDCRIDSVSATVEAGVEVALDIYLHGEAAL